MFEFLTLAENIPFSVSLLVLLIIAFTEFIGALLGTGISSIISGFFPDTDISFELEGPNIESPGSFGKVLSWLRIGQVPMLVLIIVFLTSFSISGLALQKFILINLGFVLPAIVATLPALLISLPSVRIFGGILNKIIPKDETSAVSKNSFIGRVAIITIGKASKGNAAQGKVKDKFGKYHYIMIEPDNENDEFIQGKQVILVRQEKGMFFAINNSKKIMSGG